MAKTGKPNILIIWGDDIGWFNISAYNHGIMGTGHLTLTVLRKKALSSPIGTASRVARRDGPPSFVDKTRSAPA